MRLHRPRSLAAALALAGTVLPASAQNGSQVTLYGVLDLAVESASAGLGTFNRVQSGGMMGTRWGLRGTEDLGGGLRATFVLESGVGGDTGTLQQGGRAFGRQAVVGIEGSFGAVTLGRQYSPQFWAFSRIDAFELALSAGLPVITRTRTAGSNTTQAGLLNAYVVTGRTDNSIVYTSPVWDGLRVRALAGAGEAGDCDRCGFTWGAGVHYTKGPIDANFGYTTRRDGDGHGDLKVFSVGGSVAVGDARIFLGHTRDSDTTARTATAGAPKTEYALTNLGVRYKLSAPLTLIAQYTRIADDSDGLPASRDGNVFGVGAQYDLSRRTALYGSVGTVSNQNGSNYSLGGGLWLGVPAGGNANGRSFMVGIRHLF